MLAYVVVISQIMFILLFFIEIWALSVVGFRREFHETIHGVFILLLMAALAAIPLSRRIKLRNLHNSCDNCISSDHSQENEQTESRVDHDN